MRNLIAILVLVAASSLTPQAFALRKTRDLAPPPPGATLPVLLRQTLSAHNLHPGQTITMQLLQTVPVTSQVDLPAGTKLDGHIVNVSAGALSILFDQLRWKGRTLPVHVRLIAAAGFMDVYRAKLPLGATDRSTTNPGDWTTGQIGGDEVYLSGGSGKVYDRYSQPVGFADFSGVYAGPSLPGQLPRAMGPFSTTASGLYGFPALSIVSTGDANAPVMLAASKPNWRIANGSAFLLQVTH